MKRPSMIVLFVAAVAAGMMIEESAFAETQYSVNLGPGGVIQTMPHCRSIVYIAEFEYMLDTKLALLGRGSEVSYKFDSGDYLEQGRPRGVDVGARYYPRGKMKGFFFSGTLGLWTSDWTFMRNRGRTDEADGYGTNDSVRLNLDVGDRIPLGSSSVSLMPALNVGKFFSKTSCQYTAPLSRVGTPCDQTSEVDYYLFLSLIVGIGF
jgi:hypothetical protein